MKPQITILTPTWNRRHLLPRLYQSLIDQDAPPGSCEWLVVDDGSTDGTAEWLINLIEKSSFPIRFIRQENGGKHRALNRGARELVSPWVLVVDSDDWLLPRAMERMLKDTATTAPDVLAIIAPRDIEGRPPRWFRLSGRTATFSEWMDQIQVGDTSIVMRSNLLLEQPFPEFDGEKFVAEGALYAKAFAKGGILLSNNRIIGAEYQMDGLSARSLHLRVQSPLGALAAYSALVHARASGRQNLRDKLNFHRFFWHARRAKRNTKLVDLRADVFWLLPGWVLYVRDRWKLRNDG